MAEANDKKKFELYVQTENGITTEVQFTDCILQLLGGDASCKVVPLYSDNSLTLSIDSHLENNAPAILIKHSASCPFIDLDLEQFDPDTVKNVRSKEISIAATVVVQSSDDFVLLTRRPIHMRTYPGVWVMPGGHVDPGETLETAVLRELQEETGLVGDLSKDELSMMFMWESAYPAFIGFGFPKRHHIIFYFLCKMAKDRETLQTELKLEANEVSMGIWLNKLQAKYLLANDEAGFRSISPMCEVIETNSGSSQMTTKKDVDEVFSFQGYAIGRVTAGTLFALEQWTKLNEIQTFKGSRL